MVSTLSQTFPKASYPTGRLVTASTTGDISGSQGTIALMT